MTTNRRRFVRIDADLRCTFSWDAGFELYRTTNLSAGGVQLKHHVAVSPTPPLGTEGECALNLDGVELRTEADVVRLTSDGFVLRFVRLSLTQEQRLVSWVWKQEVARLQKRR